jgi:acyl-ACP thioesterase
MKSTAAVDLKTPLRDLPDDGYVYSTAWKMLTSDIDRRRQLRLDGVARYIQEVGAEQLIDAGFDHVHPHWIVQRTVIDVLAPMTWPTDITFHRWCSAISLRWCTMRVRLDSPDGGRIETEGFWINMNKETLTPSLMDEEFFNRLATTTDEHRLKWRAWLPGPVGSDAESAPFALRHSDIDIFDHVTNTAYWHGIHEVTARYQHIACPPYRAVVEYRRPIALGDTVIIRHQADGDLVRCWFCVGDDVRAAGLVTRLER